MTLFQDRFRPQNTLYLGWAVGTFGVSLVLNLQNVAMLFFFVTVLKIEPLLAGTIITASKLYDTFTDPIMGRISDATKSRWGRRRPYLFAGGIACGLSMFLIFAVPEMPETATAIYVTAMLLVMATAYTIFNVPYLAMPAEMVEGYHDRSVMMSYRVFFISIGTFFATSGAPLLLGVLEDYLGMTQRTAYGWLGAVAGLLIATAMISSFYGTRQAPMTKEVKSTMSFKQQVGLLIGNKPFLLYLGLKLTGLFALAATLAAKFFFIKFVMQQSLSIAAIFGIAAMAGQLLSLPLWVRLSKLSGKKAVLIYSSIAQIAFSASWFLSGPDESLEIYALRGLLLGIGGCGTLLGTQAMLPDVMEYDYRRTGLRREGVYAGLASFIEKLAFALSGIAIGGYLSYMGFNKDLGIGEQSETALFAIMACQALLPIAMYVVKLVILAFYDLDERKLKSTVQLEETGETPSKA